jgi:hypothetical protein
MSWNYRVMRKILRDSEEVEEGIYEVYYNEQGAISSWTDQPIPPIIIGNKDEVAYLKLELEKYSQALNYPILDYDTGEEIMSKQGAIPKIQRLLSMDPPKKPLVDLDSVVDDWLYRFSEGGTHNDQRDKVVDWTAKQLTLKAAVYVACYSKREDGKMHNHQVKVKAEARREFADRIWSGVNLASCEDFDDLHDELERAAPKGIGPVTIYDVAVRIGAWLENRYGIDMSPSSLYLHAGVRDSWTTLFGKEKRDRIPREELPAPLQRIPTDEVEDMICCYKSVFSGWRREDV